MTNIAIVEDDELIRELISELLQRRNHQVVMFEGCQDAFEALESAPPDLLVCDVSLGDGSGLDLVARLRAIHGDAALPILVLSGMKTESDFLRGFAAGATDYLPKPFTTDELLAKVHILLARTFRQGAGASSSPDQLPGVSSGLAFDRYQLESVLGQGSYGVVYRAHDQRADRQVALKVLSALPGSQPESRLRFLRETYALASIRSPHVARIHDFGAAEGRLYYAMDLVQGPTIEQKVASDGRASEGEARLLLRGLAAALAALERAGVVHRDIKPANVILRDGRWEEPVLVDFGLAKRPFDHGLTDPQMLIGTPAYMAPEMIRGADVDHRSDLFAMGLVARYALTGGEAFPHLVGLELLQAIAARPTPLPPTIPRALRELLRQMLQVHAGMRMASAAELLKGLDLLDRVAPTSRAALTTPAA